MFGKRLSKRARQEIGALNECENCTDLDRLLLYKLDGCPARNYPDQIAGIQHSDRTAILEYVYFMPALADLDYEEKVLTDFISKDPMSSSWFKRHTAEKCFPLWTRYRRLYQLAEKYRREYKAGKCSAESDLELEVYELAMKQVEGQAL